MKALVKLSLFSFIVLVAGSQAQAMQRQRQRALTLNNLKKQMQATVLYFSAGSGEKYEIRKNPEAIVNLSDIATDDEKRAQEEKVLEGIRKSISTISINALKTPDTSSDSSSDDEKKDVEEPEKVIYSNIPQYDKKNITIINKTGIALDIVLMNPDATSSINPETGISLLETVKQPLKAYDCQEITILGNKIGYDAFQISSWNLALNYAENTTAFVSQELSILERYNDISIHISLDNNGKFEISYYKNPKPSSIMSSTEDEEEIDEEEENPYNNVAKYPIADKELTIINTTPYEFNFILSNEAIEDQSIEHSLSGNKNLSLQFSGNPPGYHSYPKWHLSGSYNGNNGDTEVISSYLDEIENYNKVELIITFENGKFSTTTKQATQ